MKILELIEPAATPRLAHEALGLLMDEENGLAIGIVSGDGGYCCPGDAGAYGRDSRRGFRGIGYGE